MTDSEFLTSLELRPLQETDLEELLQWRNRPEIRECMIHQHEISWDEHRRWFDQCQDDPAVKSFICVSRQDQSGAGFVRFSHIHKKHRTAEWGFYSGRPDIRGVGRVMGRLALDFAFNKLELRKVWAEVLESNPRSLEYHLSLGFEKEGFLKEQYQVGDTIQGVTRLGLTQERWTNWQNQKNTKNE